jgi:hypothetical protein
MRKKTEYYTSRKRSTRALNQVSAPGQVPVVMSRNSVRSGGRCGSGDDSCDLTLDGEYQRPLELQELSSQTCYKRSVLSDDRK